MCPVSLVVKYILAWPQTNINFDYFQVDVIVPTASSIQPNKAICSKYVFCQNQVEKLLFCVKTEDCGLNTFFLKWYPVLGDV